MLKLLSSFAICLFLHTMIFQLPVYAIEPLTPEELVLIEKDASNGETEAQLGVCLIYLLGKGVKKNYVKARKYCEKAAEQGNGVAQYSLGMIYKNGLGVRQDLGIAKEWYGKACDNGEQEGCDEYRKLNERGY